MSDNWNDQVIAEEIEAAKRRIEARLNQAEEIKETRAQLAAVQARTEQLLAAYDAVPDKLSPLGRLEAQKAMQAIKQNERQAKEIEARLSPQPEQAIPSGTVRLYVAGPNGEKLIDRE